MITAEEILMGRDEQYPLDEQQKANLLDLLPRLNFLRARYGKPMVVSSGYRPLPINKKVGGAKNSAHVACQAVDFFDHTGELAQWCKEHLDLLNQLGLYMEDPRYTVGWLHLQARPTRRNPFAP